MLGRVPNPARHPWGNPNPCARRTSQMSDSPISRILGVAESFRKRGTSTFCEFYKLLCFTRSRGIPKSRTIWIFARRNPRSFRSFCIFGFSANCEICDFYNAKYATSCTAKSNPALCFPSSPRAKYQTEPFENSDMSGVSFLREHIPSSENALHPECYRTQYSNKQHFLKSRKSWNLQCAWEKDFPQRIPFLAIEYILKRK